MNLKIMPDEKNQTQHTHRMVSLTSNFRKRELMYGDRKQDLPLGVSGIAKGAGAFWR